MFSENIRWLKEKLEIIFSDPTFHFADGKIKGQIFGV